MRLPSLGLGVALILVVVVGAGADVVIFKDGTYEDGRIKAATAESLTVESPYGDMSYPRGSFYSFYREDPDKPGAHYYEAGLVMLQLHNKLRAKELFDKAARLDPRYGRAGQKALQAYEPHPGTGSRPPETNLKAFRLQCPLCGGSGTVQRDFQSGSSTTGGTTSDSHVQMGGASVRAACPACGGKGYRILYLRPDEGICPTCKGAGTVSGQGSSGTTSTSTFGTVTGGSSSTSSSSTSSGGTALGQVSYPPCMDCGGRGIKPLAMGGTREGLEVVSTNVQPGGGDGGSVAPGGGEEGGSEAEAEGDGGDVEPPSDEPGFFAKYKTFLLIGVAVVLVIGLFVAKSRKK